MPRSPRCPSLLLALRFSLLKSMQTSAHAYFRNITAKPLRMECVGLRMARPQRTARVQCQTRVCFCRRLNKQIVQFPPHGARTQKRVYWRSMWIWTHAPCARFVLNERTHADLIDMFGAKYGRMKQEPTQNVSICSVMQNLRSRLCRAVVGGYLRLALIDTEMLSTRDARVWW